MEEEEKPVFPFDCASGSLSEDFSSEAESVIQENPAPGSALKEVVISKSTEKERIHFPGWKSAASGPQPSGRGQGAAPITAPNPISHRGT